MEVLINDSQIGVQTNLESEQYGIDNSSGQLFSVLSELYSRPVDSCIREICTNCNDAHIMSKKEEKPFIITLPNPDKKLFNLSIRDFGPGLNEVTISKIFTYGGSSKRDDVDSTGCLGLGAKSPYAITDTFYVKSFCDGKLTHYICFKDENNRPNKSKDPVELDTLEENGLEIIIPIWDKYDYETILKRELKYFKVKPLVYIDEGNGERSQVFINWENDPRIALTENVYIYPEVINNPILFFKGEINKKPLVEQLQIWYPLEPSVILTAIERYNLKKMYPDGSINEKYNISNIRKDIIDLLLQSGVKIKAINQVMFSPSRESIKYTERTLEYIISNLNRAAKIIEKNIITKINSIKNLDDYFENCVLKKSLYGLILDKFANTLSPKVLKFENELKVVENLYGIVNIKNCTGSRNTKFDKSILMDIYSNGMSCYNIGYSGFDPNCSGIFFEWQTKEYQEENLKIIKGLLLELYKNGIIKHLQNLKNDINSFGLDEVCIARELKLTNLVREKVSILQYIKTMGVLNEYKLIKKFIKNPIEYNPIKNFNKYVFNFDFREDLNYLQNLIIGYEYLRIGKIYKYYPVETVAIYYKTLHKLFPKIGKNGLPIFDMLEFIENLRAPKIIKRTEMPFDIKENHMTILSKSCKTSFTYNSKNIDSHSNRISYIAYFLCYYSMLKNPYVKNQLELQNMDLREYNNLIIEQLPLPKKVKNRINTKNYFVAKNERVERNIPKLETPWILVDFDERKFKSVIKQLTYKIDFLTTIYQKLTLEELALDINFTNLYKNDIDEIEVKIEDYKYISLQDTTEVPEEILVQEYSSYISRLLRYYLNLHSKFLKLKTILKKKTYVNKSSILISDRLKNLKFAHDKDFYYNYSDFININKKLYNVIKPEKIIINNVEVDAVKCDLKESLFDDIRCNYMVEAESILFTNTYENGSFGTLTSNINLLLFHRDYGYILGGHLMALIKSNISQKFGKLYIEYNSQITKKNLLENFEYLSSKYNLVSYKNSKGVMTKGRFLNFIENEKTIFGLYPKNKNIDSTTINSLINKFIAIEAPFIKKENYLFLPSGNSEYNKIIPKKGITDKLEVLFKHFDDIHKILKTKSYFSAVSESIESLVFILKTNYSSTSNFKAMSKIFLLNDDLDLYSTIYNKLQNCSHFSEFIHFYNMYKFINGNEKEFNFDNLIKTYGNESKSTWVPEVNEFYPKMKIEVFNKLKKISQIQWEVFNKLSPNIMKEFTLVAKEFDEHLKNKNLDGLFDIMENRKMFSEIHNLFETVMSIFEAYSHTSFTNNFEFLQILKSGTTDTFISDHSLLDDKTKQLVKDLFDNPDTSKIEVNRFIDARRLIYNNQDNIIRVEQNEKEMIFTFQKFLQFENIKNFTNLKPMRNDFKSPLLKNIKLFLNKNANVLDRVKRKIFDKRNIILKDVPNYFLIKWNYLNLSDKEFKRYVLNQKINRKGLKK